MLEVPAETLAAVAVPPCDRRAGRCGDAVLAGLRARLVQRCDAVGVRGALDAGLAGEALLSGVDVAALSDDDLVWAARRVQRAVNALEGSRSALVAEAARRQLQQRRGDASLADTLAATTSVSGTQARRLERDAVSVAAKPGVADALAGGGINADQAALLAAASVPEDVRARLTDDAAGQNADQTRKAVRAHEAAHRVESDLERRQRQSAVRFASMWIDQYDGMWNLRAKLDPETGDRIHRGLTRMIQRMWRTDKDLPSAQRPTVAHRSADALARLLTTGAPEPDTASHRAPDTAGVGTAPDTAADRGKANERGAGTAVAPGCTSAPGSQPNATDPNNDSNRIQHGAANPPGPQVDLWRPDTAHMIVTVTLDQLRGGIVGAPLGAAGSSDGQLVRPGMTESGTEFTVFELRKLACDAGIIPAVLNGRSEVLDIGRITRTIPPQIRRALIARDQGCVWPGCDKAPINCVGHHIWHWIDGGPTSVPNLASLCHRHHHNLHQHNLELHPPGDSTDWTWTQAEASPP
ncbi:hypothetical protein [Candidatus Poriferisodalis sp.]|uniref:HNH endonuclease signature motif containing protein n=1 Tax=Candidatus Poriferisodalis sp. TaxID=3101277 RepID=UPI003B024BBE